MAIHHEQWRGYFAASPTPFDVDGALDLARLKSTLDWFVATKPHGLVVNGTTGEWFAQTIEEREQVVEAARAVVPTDLPLLVGISSIDPRESLRLGKHAHAAGADGVLVTIPPARRLTEEDVVAFFADVAKNTPLPVLIYNVPGTAGVDIPTRLLERLQTIEGVVGVKDNTPSNAARLETLRTLGKERALFSDVLEPEAFELFAQGFGRGQIGSGMPLGQELATAFELVWSGQVDAARETVRRFTQFKSDVISILPQGQPWHAQIKALMFASGVDAGVPRFPVRSITKDKEAFAKIRNLMSSYLNPAPEDQGQSDENQKG
ncbi:hypothetical protein A8B82_01635 [Sulfitobacter sp. EhC04]|uniref:dihydrodipicolinate synthase family protein n=1 Tax=Sulfitobacter sp. EhC04 TaxID=1849168 RepID=UPI0007F3FD48|nr:dihydrodipicolinate synthase family protein [Sulfitobacter sp. EhC04]OAN75660.1 hypothetical protein A8B82_01635 [Sulfitobacter sp. EhC04]